MSETLWSFDTVVWQQSMVRDDAYTLERYYKGITPHEQRTRIAALGAVPNSFITPLIDDVGVARYRLPGDRTLFSLIYDPDTDVDRDGLFAELGRELAGVNRPVLQNPVCPLPWNRLKVYIGPDYPDSVEDLRFLLGRKTLDYSRWLVEFVETQDAVFGLGGVGLGGIFVDGSNLIIPCGPEAGSLAPEWDLAWIIGELTELEHAFLRRGQSGERVAHYGTQLVNGYTQAGGEIDLERLSALSSLRTLLHYFDFSATYPDQFPDEEHGQFVEWLITRAYSLATKDKEDD